MNPRRVWLALLALYALLFVALSVDIMVRIWEWRGRFESPLDVAALFYFEGVRTFTTVAGVAIAVWAAQRTTARAGLRELPFALLLATIAYTKVAAFRGFPGAQQERLAGMLQEARIPPVVLDVVFAQPAWTAWGALAACVLLVAQYPRRLESTDIAASGEADRRGAMRDVALAGTDVGALSRRAAARLVSVRWLRPSVLYPLSLAVGIGHALAARSVGFVAHVLALLVAAAVVAMLVSMFRAAFAVAADQERVVLEWLRRGVLAGGALFVVSGVAAIALRGSVIAVAALSLAPAAVLVGVAIAVSKVGRRERLKAGTDLTAGTD
jgi:hypothetical protein